MKNVSRFLPLALGIAASAASAFAADIAQWNFNGASATTVAGGAASPAASFGSGAASLFGGATAAASFGSGNANGGSSDPVATTPNDYGWQTTTYGATAGGAGVQFLISTVGYTSAGYGEFVFSYDLRHSNTSSRYEQVQYTTNGSTWTDVGAFFDGNAGDTWFNGRSVSITDPAAFNNASFGLRITTSGGGDAVLDASATTYASSGTWRFDMVTLSATAVPEPASAAALAGAAILGFAMNRRRRGA